MAHRCPDSTAQSEGGIAYVGVSQPMLVTMNPNALGNSLDYDPSQIAVYADQAETQLISPGQPTISPTTNLTVYIKGVAACSSEIQPITLSDFPNPAGATPPQIRVILCR